MSGSNNGTGYPLTLKCRARRRNGDAFRCLSVDLEATGRTREAEHLGYRQIRMRVEYKCRRCGHVGWTQHSDAARLLRRLEA